MSQLNELKIAAMRTVASVSSGSINEAEHAYLDFYSATADTELNEKWQEVFAAHAATSTNWNEAATQFLHGQGHTSGTLNERWIGFWTAGGTIV